MQLKTITLFAAMATAGFAAADGERGGKDIVVGGDRDHGKQGGDKDHGKDDKDHGKDKDDKDYGKDKDDKDHGKDDKDHGKDGEKDHDKDDDKCKPDYEEYECDKEDGKGTYTTTYTVYPTGCPGYTQWAELPAPTNKADHGKPDNHDKDNKNNDWKPAPVKVDPPKPTNWVDAKDPSKDWFKGKDGKDWYHGKDGKDWYYNDKDGKNYYHDKDGKDYYHNDKDGKDYWCDDQGKYHEKYDNTWKPVDPPKPTNWVDAKGKDYDHGKDYDWYKGKDGKDWYHGKDGKDYYRGKDGHDYYHDNDGKDYFHGKDGKDYFCDDQGKYYVKGSKDWTPVDPPKSVNWDDAKGKDYDHGKYYEHGKYYGKDYEHGKDYWYGKDYDHSHDKEYHYKQVWDYKKGAKPADWEEVAPVWDGKGPKKPWDPKKGSKPSDWEEVAPPAEWDGKGYYYKKPWDYKKGPKPAEWEEYAPVWDGKGPKKPWDPKKGAKPAEWDEYAPPAYYVEKNGDDWKNWEDATKTWNPWGPKPTKYVEVVDKDGHKKKVVIVTIVDEYDVPCSTGWEHKTKTIYTTHCGCTETPVPVKAEKTTYVTDCPESWGLGKKVTVTVPVEPTTTWAEVTMKTPEADEKKTWETVKTPVADEKKTWEAVKTPVADASTWATVPVKASNTVWAPVAKWTGAAADNSINRVMVAAAGAVAGLALAL